MGSSWSYGSWIYNYLCNQCLWVRIPPRRDVLDTTLCDKVCQWLATGQWFSPGTLVSSTNKTDRYDITKILLKVALNTITITFNTIFSTKIKMKFEQFFLTLLFDYILQKGLKNVFDEAILAALEPPEPPKKKKCVLL